MKSSPLEIKATSISGRISEDNIAKLKSSPLTLFVGRANTYLLVGTPIEGSLVENHSNNSLSFSSPALLLNTTPFSSRTGLFTKLEITNLEISGNGSCNWATPYIQDLVERFHHHSYNLGILNNGLVFPFKEIRYGLGSLIKIAPQDVSRFA